MKGLLLLLFGALAAIGVAQGAGGFGGGGGGIGGDPGVSEEKDSSTKSHILTRGDKGEWALKVNDNETIIAKASSRIFDPAIEVVDEKGNILAQNDDIALGEQDALVLYRFSKAGDYKIWVKGYKSAAGGEYTFTLRRFVAREMNPGDRLRDTLEVTDSKWFRIPLKKGQTLTSTLRSGMFAPRFQVYSPDGLKVETPRANERAVVKDFVASQDGEHYLRVGGGIEHASFEIAALLAKEGTATTNGETGPQPLEADGLHLWTVPGKAGELVKLEAISSGPAVHLQFEKQEKDGEDAQQPQLLAYDEKRNRARYFLLLEDGVYRCRVKQDNGRETQYNLQIVPSTESFPSNSLTGELAMGQARFYELSGQTGDIWRIAGSSQTFDVQMSLLTDTGDVLVENADFLEGTDSQVLALLPKNGRYILRVDCEGGGGAGSFQLDTAQVQPKALSLNSKQSGTATPTAQEIWRLEGEAGKTILVSVRSRQFNPLVALVGPDGHEIARDDNGGDGADSLLSVKLPANGTYTIWIYRAGGGEGVYDLRLLDLDS